MSVPALRFTEADAELAADEWGANCGPGALAAVLGKTLEEVRPHIPAFAERGYTNPSMMYAALKSLGARFTMNWDKEWPRFGLVRIQWEGPWTREGVPIRARYRHTHWIGACALAPANIGIFDINCMNSGGWVRLADWEATIVPHILRECVPRADGGWHRTHSIELAQ